MKVSKVQGKLELKNSGGLSLFFIAFGIKRDTETATIMLFLFIFLLIRNLI